MNFKSIVSKGLSVLLSEFFVVSVICALEYAYFHSYDVCPSLFPISLPNNSFYPLFYQIALFYQISYGLHGLLLFSNKDRCSSLDQSHQVHPQHHPNRHSILISFSSLDILLCALLIAFSYLYMHTEYYSSKVYAPSLPFTPTSWSFITTTLPIPYNRILYDLYKYLQVRFYFVLLLFVYTVPVLTGCILLFHLFKHLSHLYLFVSTFLKNMFNEKEKKVTFKWRKKKINHWVESLCCLQTKQKRKKNIRIKTPLQADNWYKDPNIEPNPSVPLLFVPQQVSHIAAQRTHQSV